MAKITYDCTNRTFRDKVRGDHDISEDDYNAMVANFYQGNNPPPVTKSWNELGIADTSCGKKLIKIKYIKSVINSNYDLDISVINWQDDPEDDPNTPELETYFSDIYFNACRVHFGMSTIEFRKARRADGKYTAVIRFKTPLTAWHHGNLTSMHPLAEQLQILP